MKSKAAVDRLIQFLCDFAQEDFDKKTKGEKQVMKERLFDYFIRITQVVPDFRFGARGEYGDDLMQTTIDSDLLQLQTDVRNKLNAVLNFRLAIERSNIKAENEADWIAQANGTWDKSVFIQETMQDLPLRWEFWPDISEKRFLIRLRGSIRNVFLASLFVLLRNETDENKIMRCPRTDCPGVEGGRRIFYKIRKQKFCSIQCARKAAKQRREDDAPLIYSRWNKTKSKSKKARG